MKVSQLMSKQVVSVELPCSREDVLELMRQHKISGIPVLKDGKLVGIVTRWDLIMHSEEDQVALLMSRNPVVISEDSHISQAARMMVENDVTRLPVVDSKHGDRLVGMLTAWDLMRYLSNSQISDPVAAFMEKTTFPIWDQTPLKVVGRIMELADIKAAPVIDSELRLVGVVTDLDLVAAATVKSELRISQESEVYDADSWSWEGVRDVMTRYYSISKVELPLIPVSRILRRGIKGISKLTPVNECARIMIRSKLDVVPVISGEHKLVGIVRDRDLLKSLYR